MKNQMKNVFWGNQIFTKFYLSIWIDFQSHWNIINGKGLWHEELIWWPSLHFLLEIFNLDSDSNAPIIIASHRRHRHWYRLCFCCLIRFVWHFSSFWNINQWRIYHIVKCLQLIISYIHARSENAGYLPKIESSYFLTWLLPCLC